MATGGPKGFNFQPNRGSVLSTIQPSVYMPSHSSTSRCSQCSRPNAEGTPRNIIVCIDGTSNQFGQKNTNIVKLFAKIDLETNDPKQYAYYSSGIGTRPKSLHIVERLGRAFSDKFDMAIAWNMEEIVKDAYGWLARTYREGDQIYLFGFSRGAYQVRVLAGMIHEVGLIRTPTEKQIGTAYDHYESIRSKKPKTKQIAREFKNTFSWKGLRVHFVGVWDTVSSVGLIRGDVFLSTSASASHACHFRHALALDELRVKFMPEYFHEMNSQTYDSKSNYCRKEQDGDRVGMGSKSKSSESIQQDSSAIASSSKSPASGQENIVANESNVKTPIKRQGSTLIDNISPVSEEKEHFITEVKEVWFAGCHSDVGGTTRPGRSHQAGNVSLLWMRREAVENGLVLKPTDVVWVPDDLDFGTSNSMKGMWWKAIEYLPIKHQTCFSGSGEDTRRWHRMQPRRIIPGQKVHASVLYANAYKPLATLGEGFDIPIIHAEPEDTDLGNEIWENGLFDKTAGRELMDYLSSPQGIAPIYLDRLLFMLRFEEGKNSVREVSDWKDRLKNLVRNAKTSFVRLVALVAYYEAASDTVKDEKSLVQPPEEFKFSDKIYEDARKCLQSILAKHKHRDGPRVVALLRPLTKHDILREHILTKEVLESLMSLLDEILRRPAEGNFGQAMNALNCLLQCDKTRNMFVEKLKEPFADVLFNKSRLCKILEVENAELLTAALRMVLTFSRIPEARRGLKTMDAESAENPTVTEEARRATTIRQEETTEVARVTETEPEEVAQVTRVVATRPAGAGKPRKASRADEVFWLDAKRRIRQLAQSKDRLAGRLAVEILFVLYDADDPNQLNVHNSNFRANIVSALISLKTEQQSSDDKRVGDNGTEEEFKMLQRVFGFGVTELNDNHRKLIRRLPKAIEWGNARERTAATLTLLKLSETKAIRDFLHEKIGLVNVFIGQLQKKNEALLAAYALVAILKHPKLKDSEMATSIRNNALLPKYIVGMLRMDYFDDAIGQVEGFEIFSDFMRHGDLQDKIKRYNITEILSMKLEKGKPRETRTSLICLDIFLSFDSDGPWAESLVKKSVGLLRNEKWSEQKAGVIILSALSQTQRGTDAISDWIHEIIKMLIPEDYIPMNAGSSEHLPSNASVVIVSANEGEVTSANDQSPGALTSGVSHTDVASGEGRNPTQSSTASVDLSELSEPSSRMMGPACALRILAQNEQLRMRTHEIQEYSLLKNLHLTGTLVSEANTSPWKIKTPNKDDVTQMLDKMIKAVDKEISEEGLMTVGDAVLPRIKHWDRLWTMLRNRTVWGVTLLPAVIGISTLAALAVVVVPPVYLSGVAYGFLQQLLSQHENSRMRYVEHTAAGTGSDAAAAGLETATGRSNGNEAENAQDV